MKRQERQQIYRLGGLALTLLLLLRVDIICTAGYAADRSEFGQTQYENDSGEDRRCRSGWYLSQLSDDLFSEPVNSLERASRPLQSFKIIKKISGESRLPMTEISYGELARLPPVSNKKGPAS